MRCIPNYAQLKLSQIFLFKNFPCIIDYSDDLPKSAPILPAKCGILPPGNVLAAQTDSADRSIPSFLRQLVLSPGKRMSETYW